MQKSTKLLGLGLIILALACFIGGGTELKNTLNDKTYWEDKNLRTSDDLTTLENGLNTLRDNEPAYRDGLVSYENGLRDYEKGQQELATGQEAYDEGLATLNAKQQEYDQGMLALQAAAAELAAGKETLDANYPAYIAGKEAIAQGEPEIAAARTLLSEKSAQLQQVGALVAKLQDLSTQFNNWATAYHNWFAAQPTAAQAADTSSSPTNPPELLQTQKQQLAAAVMQIFGTALSDPNLTQQVTDAIGADQLLALQGIVSQLSEDNCDKFQTDMAQISSVTSNALFPIYEKGTSALQASQQTLAAKEAELAAGKAKIAEYEQGEAVYQAGLAEYYAGKAQLENGAAELAAGQEQLNAAHATIETGQQALKDAEAKLASGKADLEKFEAGQDQAIAGIDTVLASETYGNLASIADRLGPDYQYVNGDGSLNIAQGFAALTTAREFAADSATAITQDLTRRTITAIITLVIGALALIASIVLFVKSSRRR